MTVQKIFLASEVTWFKPRYSDNLRARRRWWALIKREIKTGAVSSCTRDEYPTNFNKIMPASVNVTETLMKQIASSIVGHRLKPLII